jgi:rhamnulokinase
MAERGSIAYDNASHLLMVPDLLGFFLTGERRVELTNASTTQLVDTRSGTLAVEVFRALGLRHDFFSPLSPPGHPVGPVLSQVASSVGLTSPVEVLSVASHDTASAVLAVPAVDDDFAYLVSGTWSLVGLELDHAVVTDESRVANFSNELGIDGTVTFLRNVMGHWMLQECRRRWAGTDGSPDMGELMAQARQCAPFRSVVGTDRPEFATPGDMPERVRAACAESGEPVPETRGEVARCTVDSMALAIANALADALRCARRQVRVLHVVGGGVANDLLLELVAACTGMIVVAGPVEASAVGNLLVQLRAAGRVGDRQDMRDLVARSFPLRVIEPDAALQRRATAAAGRLAAA